jgi:pimeloyl-ACP methyl ester carboxylesterase
MEIKEQYYQHNDIRLYYFTQGKGKPLLFLPGGLRVSAYMRNITLLAQSYQVIGLDLPGFGKSSVPKDVWSLEDYADLISHFLTDLHLPKIPVIGHSYGGGVGLYLAMSDKHITKLMVFSPMGVASDQSSIQFLFNVLVTKTINDYFAMKSQRLRAIVFNNAISTVTGNFANAVKMIQVTRKVLYKNITPEELAKIQIPVKLMWGENDELFPLLNGFYLRQYIKKSQLEVLNGNHDWLTINPEESTKKITEFIK